MIADDHPIVRRGLKQTLRETSDIVVADEAADSAEVLEKLRSRRFDVLLLDISMPGRGGIDVLNEMRSAKVSTPALVLSVFPEEQYAERALKCGASGYLMKNCEAETLIEAIRKVASGGTYVSAALAEQLASSLRRDDARAPHEQLSNREYAVLIETASGKTVREIADALRLSPQTVSTYRARVLEKMRMKSAAELTAYVYRTRLVNP
jgi:DNA-binding NarL/FixJ family response regulator